MIAVRWLATLTPEKLSQAIDVMNIDELRAILYTINTKDVQNTETNFTVKKLHR